MPVEVNLKVIILIAIQIPTILLLTRKYDYKSSNLWIEYLKLSNSYLQLKFGAYLQY